MSNEELHAFYQTTTVCSAYTVLYNLTSGECVKPDIFVKQFDEHWSAIYRSVVELHNDQ